MAYLIISSYPTSLPLFSKLCTDHKLYSMATGNNYGERRTQWANNYYHVRQRYEVIAYSLSCLLPTNGMPWELQQGPIRFEGHKQVTEFSFMVVWWIVTRVPTRKQRSSFISSPFHAEMSSMRVISSTVVLCGGHCLWVIRWGGFKLVNKLMKQRFDLNYCIRTNKYLLAGT